MIIYYQKSWHLFCYNLYLIFPYIIVNYFPSSHLYTFFLLLYRHLFLPNVCFVSLYSCLDSAFSVFGVYFFIFLPIIILFLFNLFSLLSLKSYFSNLSLFGFSVFLYFSFIVELLLLEYTKYTCTTLK